MIQITDLLQNKTYHLGLDLIKPPGVISRSRP